jgi:hypothetical protein
MLADVGQLEVLLVNASAHFLGPQQLPLFLLVEMEAELAGEQSFPRFLED